MADDAQVRVAAPKDARRMRTVARQKKKAEQVAAEWAARQAALLHAITTQTVPAETRRAPKPHQATVSGVGKIVVIWSGARAQPFQHVCADCRHHEARLAKKQCTYR